MLQHSGRREQGRGIVVVRLRGVRCRVLCLVRGTPADKLLVHKGTYCLKCIKIIISIRNIKITFTYINLLILIIY